MTTAVDGPVRAGSARGRQGLQRVFCQWDERRADGGRRQCVGKSRTRRGGWGSGHEVRQVEQQRGRRGGRIGDGRDPKGGLGSGFECATMNGDTVGRFEAQHKVHRQGGQGHSRQHLLFVIGALQQCPDLIASFAHLPSRTQCHNLDQFTEIGEFGHVDTHFTAGPLTGCQLLPYHVGMRGTDRQVSE